MKKQASSFMKSLGSLLFGCAIGCIAVVVITPLMIFYLSERLVTNEADESPALEPAENPVAEPLSPSTAKVMEEAQHDPDRTGINS